MNSMIDDKYNRYYENKEKKHGSFTKKCLFIVLLTASNRHLRHSAYRKNNNIEHGSRWIR